MRRSFKYRLYPGRAQIKALEYQLAEACDLYNCALEERRGAWKTCRKSVNYYDQANQLKQMRAEGLIGLANFNACQDVLRRLDRAFCGFFSRVKRGEKPGFPRFKSLRQYDSLTFPRHGNGCSLRVSTLRVQDVGEIKIKLHRPIDGKIKTVCLKREAGRWFAVFTAESEISPLRQSDQKIGIDVGLSTFATLSDGSEIDNPRCGIRAERSLRIAQRKVSRRGCKSSNRRRKAIQILRRQYVRVASRRADFHHKVSRSLVNHYGLIVVEDLNIKGLSRGMLAKSVQDAGWGNFLNKLAYKAESAGRELIRVNPKGTSQTCICGVRVPKTLRDRWHLCTACGLSAGRDHVSAQVILGLGLSLRDITWPEVGASVLREAVAA